MIKSIAKFLLSFGLVLLAAGSFSISKAQGLGFTLRSMNTGLCLAVQSDDPNPGGNLITWNCNGAQSQTWFQGDATANPGLTEIFASGQTGPNAFTLLSQLGGNCHSSPCLVAGVQAGRMQNGTQVITWTEDPTKFGVSGATNNQGWVWQYVAAGPNGNSCYVLLNAGGSQGGPPFALTEQNGWAVISRVDEIVGIYAFPFTNQEWCLIPNQPIE